MHTVAQGSRLPISLLCALLCSLGVNSIASAQCEAQKLSADIMAEADHFADRVAISGDLAVIGASRHDYYGSASGTAYVFRYDDLSNQWIQEAQLFAFSPALEPDGAANDLFGWSTAIDAGAAQGPVIVVGGYLDDDTASASGSAYVFRYHSGAGTWEPEAKLHASDAAMGDEFGQCVAVSDDVIVIGAARDDDGDADTGSVYVFRFNGANWIQEAKLHAPDAAWQDRFGSSVAVSGDAIIVGSALHDQIDPPAVNSGAAYVFSYVAPSWSAPEILIPDDASAGDKFGESVAIEGGLAIIGAPLNDQSATNAGAAYIFSNAGGWFQEAKLTPSDPHQYDQFGMSVAILSDPDGGGDIAIVGTPLADGFGDASGSAYVFRYLGFWAQQAALSASDAEENDEFANSVAVSARAILIGASKNDDPSAGLNAGSAYAFTVETIVCEDCDQNGTVDAIEISSNPDLDCNSNGTLDVCEIDENSPAPGGPFFCTQNCDPDCNDNGVPDACDIDDATSTDLNGNGVPDECEDCNDNGTPDDLDLSSGTSEDCNNNALPDECDIADGSSADCNGNGVPDSCDIAQGTSADTNANGIPDECEDCDGNGIEDFLEIVFNPELDCNGNETLDICEIDEHSSAPGGPFYCTVNCDPDCNVNGIPDACDISDGVSDDANANGIPDECEDCNANGLLDSEEIAAAPEIDCNANGTIDACEIDENSSAPGGPFYCLDNCDPDCNDNGIPDACDIADASSADCDANDVPDECDPDCNANGVPDGCDVDPADPDGNGQTSPDFNANSIPDECEPDCDDDGYPDFLEIMQGWSDDCDDNGVPDECDPDCDFNGIPDACEGIVRCPEDLACPHGVEQQDLNAVLNRWGDPDCEPGGGAYPCPEDLIYSDGVDQQDLNAVLNRWGDPACAPAPLRGRGDGPSRQR